MAEVIGKKYEKRSIDDEEFYHIELSCLFKQDTPIRVK